MSHKITVHLDKKPIYDIVLESSFDGLAKEVAQLSVAGKKICIVTDTTVANLYLEEVKSLLLPYCKKLTSFVFPAGEAHKNLNTVKDLYETLILEKFERKDILVALGGGVVGDLCGFAAATYLRGIPFIQIPTTLLSQVDSSIGGKTGVDFDSYKNMVGAFHMPLLVYSNTGSLLTLTEEQFSSGMGEIIKHGLIKAADYYQWLIDHADQILTRDQDICKTMILKSDLIKRKVVEEDPGEQGERALLNFGHTLGHAIEKLMNFQFPHGQCVGLGSLAAAFISAERGLIPMETVENLKRVLNIFGIPISISGLDPKIVIEITKSDKKMDAGVIRFILLKAIGEAYVDSTVTEKEMERALSYLLE